MKKNQIKIAFLLLVVSIFAACKKDEQPKVEQQTEEKFIRLLISDANSNSITFLNPATGETTAFNARHPKAALYTTASGRYATLIHREFNFVENFDSGFEFHGDHVDVKGTPKFAFMTGSPNKPTHFKSKGDEIITFNDGDATLSIAKEGNFQVQGSVMQTINTGLTAHHGAMTKFNNGNYAITVKDGSVAGALPERVKIINASGAEVSPSTIQTKGIHGNASNGLVSLFGSASGILVVQQNGNQELINYPTSFGTAWFGSILEASAANKFIGFTAALGAYRIDTDAKSITPILESTDIMQCKVDYAGKNLVILLFDGSLKIYDAASGNLKAEGKVLPATAKDSKTKPFLVATNRYVYLVSPALGEVKQVNTANFSDTKTIKISSEPFAATLIGFENSQVH